MPHGGHCVGKGQEAALAVGCGWVSAGRVVRGLGPEASGSSSLREAVAHWADPRPHQGTREARKNVDGPWR